ncbi:Major sperm protein [Aphelenchoides fujianensis]|nr:Major sperm protein [Aphelenchoides fujianensis]
MSGQISSSRRRNLAAYLGERARVSTTLTATSAPKRPDHTRNTLAAPLLATRLASASRPPTRRSMAAARACSSSGGDSSASWPHSSALGGCSKAKADSRNISTATGRAAEYANGRKRRLIGVFASERPMQMRAHKSRAANGSQPFKCACLCSLPALPPAARMSDLPLKLEPAERLVFAGKKLGAEPANATLKVTNPTADRMAFKIKCTSNEMFRIRPVIGVVKAKEETTVTLIFNAGKSVPENGKHYFARFTARRLAAPLISRSSGTKRSAKHVSAFCGRHTHEKRGSQSAKTVTALLSGLLALKMVVYIVLFPTDSNLIHALNLDRTPLSLVYVNVVAEVCWLNGLIKFTRLQRFLRAHRFNNRSLIEWFVQKEVAAVVHSLRPIPLLKASMQFLHFVHGYPLSTDLTRQKKELQSLSTRMFVWLLPPMRRVGEGATYAPADISGSDRHCCVLPRRVRKRHLLLAMKLLLVVLPSIEMPLGSLCFSRRFSRRTQFSRNLRVIFTAVGYSLFFLCKLSLLVVDFKFLMIARERLWSAATFLLRLKENLLDSLNADHSLLTVLYVNLFGGCSWLYCAIRVNEHKYKGQTLNEFFLVREVGAVIAVFRN